MTCVVAGRDMPKGSVILVNEARPIDYLDCYTVSLPYAASVSADDLTHRIFVDSPAFVRWLLALRDTLVKPFGLKTAPKTSDARETRRAGDTDGLERTAVPTDPVVVRLKPGDRAGLFNVSHRLEHEIVMAEQDRHLDFRVSVRQCRSASNELVVSVTTAVWFNNGLGKLYFYLIRPFHCAILRNTMKRLHGRLLCDLRNRALA